MMSRDWFRNETWSDVIEKHFFDKLSRARKRDQYLRIQAWHLTKVAPGVSLRLIDQFFSLDDPFDEASAYQVRADAYQTLGRIDDAIQAYRDAIATEEARPSIQTNSWLEFAVLVAMRKRTELYDEVSELIDKRWKNAVFPVQQFQQYGVLAIVAASNGYPTKAKTHAAAALETPARKDSGISHHRTVGLVGDRYPELCTELKRIVAGKQSAIKPTLLQRLRGHLP
jgi:tetratricopeptide (TPR) repeat protein